MVTSDIFRGGEARLVRDLSGTTLTDYTPPKLDKVEPNPLNLLNFFFLNLVFRNIHTV